MAENRAIMEVLLAAEDKKEAKDVLDFTRLFSVEQQEKLKTLLEGVKIGFDLATGGAVKQRKRGRYGRSN